MAVAFSCPYLNPGLRQLIEKLRAGMRDVLFFTGTDTPLYI
jgi:hypothetical protein